MVDWLLNVEEPRNRELIKLRNIGDPRKVRNTLHSFVTLDTAVI
jgi:hypothetical protein